MYVQSRGWEWEVLNLNETELGGVKEAIIAVNGRGAYNRLKYESGVHRVQRVPETETQGRIHTSTATVAVMPQAEEVDFALDMKDLRIDTFRSSGAGGQHINKTSSAIRVTHLPTGMVVECQNERSQFQNKDKALEILRSRLLAQKQKEQQDAINANRQGQVGTGDRSEKIRTYNFPQDRCTDHRIGLTVHNLDKIMDGNLDEIIDALAMREQAEKLRQLDPALSLHDLRIVPGKTHTNVLFDLVLPAGYAGDKVELLTQMEQFIKEQDPTYNCIIKVEQSYTAAHQS